MNGNKIPGVFLKLCGVHMFDITLPDSSLILHLLQATVWEVSTPQWLPNSLSYVARLLPVHVATAYLPSTEPYYIDLLDYLL